MRSGGTAWSLPARGVWVEILTYDPQERRCEVTPREGSVG